jgi:quinoprotein glucose dehydrogenase
VTLLLLAALLAQEPDAGPAGEGEAWAPRIEPASEEAEHALSDFELLAGFEAEVFAAEPRLANPVCLYVDHRGDVWVAETFRHHEGVTDMRDHLGWLDEDLASTSVGERLAMMARHEGDDLAAYRRASERVRWLSDTDGDGRADVDAVFAEGFDAAEAGIGAGLLVHGGEVYYTCIPTLWRLGDDDGNRRADRREALSTGYGVNVALLGHDLHGLRIGPDGKLYFSCGDRGFRVETAEGVLEHAHTGAVLRC